MKPIEFSKPIIKPNEEDTDKKISKIEIHFSEGRYEWNNTLLELINKSKRSSDFIEVQALVLSYKQMLHDEIALLSNKITYIKESLALKRNKVFQNYNSGNSYSEYKEKEIKLESDMASTMFTLNLIENHIEFLRGCIDNIKQLNFNIKNTLQFEYGQ